MNQHKDNTSSIFGCAFFIFSGTILGGIWIGTLLISDFNYWLLAFLSIIFIHILVNARYIFINPIKDTFYLGRQLCFISFPAFSNILFLIIWYQTYNWGISVSSAIVAGWLIYKGLQSSLFAHEYTYRDNPDNRETADMSQYNPMQSHNLNIEGIRLAKNGYFKEALLKFEKAIELNPIDPNPRICISNILIIDGRYTEAETQLLKALELNPTRENEQNLYNNLGNLNASKKNFLKAIEYYKKSISVYQPDEQIYVNTAQCLEQLGEWDEALKYFELSYQYSANQKAYLGTIRVKRRKTISAEMDRILNTLKSKNYLFPKCGNHSLSEKELRIIEVLNDSSTAFFVGAGISFPYPSCLLMASDILKIIFHINYELDKVEISNILQITNEKEAYKKLCCELAGVKFDSPEADFCILPFEPTFQVLFDSFGYPAIRFVDLLEIGKPNLHHRMLAQSLKKGHTVVTTNFDHKIENAIDDSNIKILISDKDFQHAIDNSWYDGVLAKIHGDISDYGSLALTMSGVAAGSDRSMIVGDDIHEKKAVEQAQQIDPGTFLSIPKALWLQNVLKKKKICVMGYSGSDAADIMPILKNREYNCRGVWVEYAYQLPQSVEEWVKNNKDRVVLKPENEKERSQDVPAKVSNFFIEQFGGHSGVTLNEEIDLTIINSTIVSWIDRLRLRPGDGLVFLARLYSQRGHWQKAELLYNMATKKYEKDIENNEMQWLLAKSNVGYVKDYLDRKDEALKISQDIRNYLEINNLLDSYPQLYANTLLNIAIKYVNTDKDNEAAELVEKANRIAQEINDKTILCFGLRIAADRYYHRKEYNNALEVYLSIYKIWSDDIGDSRESCICSMSAALCFAQLGDQYNALHMVAVAESFANYLGDKNLIEQVHHNSGYIFTLFIGESPALYFHESLITKAKVQIGKENEREIDEVMEHIQRELYDHCLKMIDRIMQKYDHVDIQLLMLFLKSNIYHRTQKTDKEIEVLLEFNTKKPDFPIVEHNLGNAYSIVKKYDDAEGYFLRSIEHMKGTYPLSSCNLGIMYADMKRKTDAIKYLEIAEREKAPENSLNILRQRISEI